MKREKSTYFNLFLKIVIYEHDRPFARKLETLVRDVLQVPTVLNTGAVSEVEQYIIKSHPPTLYILDMMTDDHFCIGKRLALHIQAAAPMDRYMFVTSYPNVVRDEPYISRNGTVTVYKHHDEFEYIFKKALQVALDDVLRCLLWIKMPGEIRLISPYEINYITTAYKNTLLYKCTSDTISPVVTGTLAGVMKQIENPAFLRVHRAYIAFIPNTRRWDTRNKTIYFRDGSQCPFSNKYISPAKIGELDYLLRLCPHGNRNS